MDNVWEWDRCQPSKFELIQISVIHCIVFRLTLIDCIFLGSILSSNMLALSPFTSQTLFVKTLGKYRVIHTLHTYCFIKNALNIAINLSAKLKQASERMVTKARQAITNKMYQVLIDNWFTELNRS